MKNKINGLFTAYGALEDIAAVAQALSEYPQTDTSQRMARVCLPVVGGELGSPIWFTWEPHEYEDDPEMESEVDDEDDEAEANDGDDGAATGRPASIATLVLPEGLEV